MKAISNFKLGFNAARARWNVAAHTHDGQKNFMGHSTLVRAGRALTECDFERIGLQIQPRGGGCDVRLQPRFLGIADR